jgi:signal transduction histidine kinase
VLFVRSQAVDNQAHSQYRSDLRLLDGLQATLNENILQAQLGILRFYDPINAVMDEIDEVESRLMNVPDFIGEQGQREILALIQTHHDLMADKAAAVEHFKTQNAVFLNSLSYFTIVVSDITSQANRNVVDAAVSSTLNGLLENILLYAYTTNEDLILVIQDVYLVRLVDDLTIYNGILELGDVDPGVITRHANIILEQKPRIDALVSQIVGSPVSAQIDALSSVYNQRYESARAYANAYLAGFFTLLLMMLAYAAVQIIISLKRSTVIYQRATRLAQETSRLKDEFLATMSHELRTPLNAMIGYLGIMKMTANLTKEDEERVDRVRVNSERLLGLINDILDISRIESGQMELVPSDIRIRDLLSIVEGQMRVLADQKRLDFVVNIDDDVPDVVHFDEDAVAKILINLLGNAIKFTDQGQVSLYMRRDYANLIIQVSDTGEGVPPHMLETIFDRFRQVDGSNKRKHGGTGLGLAITRNLCVAMGGNINIRSEVGHGSTFTIKLPLETIQEQIVA